VVEEEAAMLGLGMIRSSTALMAPTAFQRTASGEDAAAEEARRRRQQARARETRRILIEFREAQRGRWRGRA
jgi:hypothetical protein